jgi:hypothetical protein
LKFWIADKLEGKNKIQCFRSKWFNSDKDEEESNNIHYQNYGVRASSAVTTSLEGASNVQMSQNTKLGRAMTPGEEILRSVQGGLSAFKKTESSSKRQEAYGSGDKQTKGNLSEKKNSKGKSKKRLFSDTPAAQWSTNYIAKSKAELGSSSGTLLNSNEKKVSVADKFNFSCESWESFQFDRDRVYRALMGELVVETKPLN